MAELFVQGNSELVRKLNLLVNELNSLRRMQGGPFIRIVSTPSGTTFRLNIDEVVRRVPKFKGSGGGNGTGNPSLSGWFELIDTDSSPMLGQQQTCSAGVFSDAEPYSAAEGVSIYPHPQSAIANYVEGDIIFANFVGNCWVAVNIISDIDTVDILFSECPS